MSYKEMAKEYTDQRQKTKTKEKSVSRSEIQSQLIF